MALNDSKKLVELDFRIVGDKMYNAALQKAENATDRFGNKLGTVIGVQNTQLTKSLDSTGKRTQKLSAEFLHAGGAVTKSTAQMKNGMVSVTATTKNMGDAAKKSTGMTNDFTRALKRVIVVVPLWASLRMVMSAVTTTIKEGVKTILTLDEELQKVATTIELTGVNTAKVLKRLKNESTMLSKETGISVDKIVNAYYRFSTVGNSVEDSFNGMNASVKQAVALQGDITKVATINALTFKLLGETLDKNLSSQEKQLVIGAKVAKLYRWNAFTQDEFSASIKQFLPVANNLNMTLDETFAILATVSSKALQGSKGGRLLRTSFTKLVQNIDDAKEELDLYTDSSDSVFDTTIKVLGALRKLGEEGRKIESFKAIAKIFGGVRGALPVQALTAGQETLSKALKDVSGSTEDQKQQITELLTTYDRMNDSASGLAKQNKVLKGFIGQAFLEGITGANNMQEALATVKVGLEALIPLSKDVGDGLRFIATVGFTTLSDAKIARANMALKFQSELIKSIKKELSSTEELALLDKLTEKTPQRAALNIGLAESGANVEKEINDLKQRIAANIRLEMKIKLDKDGAANEVQELADETEKALKSIDLGTDFYDKIRKIRAESLKDIEEIQKGDSVTASRTKLLNYTKELVKQYNARLIANKKNLPPLKEEEIIAKVLAGKWQEIADLSKENIFTENTLLTLAKQLAETKKDTLKISKAEADIKQDIYLATLKSTGLDDLTIAQKKVDYLISERGLTQGNLDLLKATRDIELERLKIITNRVNQVKSSTQTAFKTAFEEEGVEGLNSFLDSFLKKFREGVQETMMDSISSGLTNALFQFTGIGDMFGGIFQTAEQRLPMAIENAFTVGGDSVANKITTALSSAPIGGAGGANAVTNKLLGTLGMDRTGYAKVGGKDVPVAPADYYKTQGIEKAVEKGTAKNSMFNMQNLGKAVGVGLLAFGLFGSGKSQDSQSQKYATADAFNGVSGTSDATTRSSTRAKITNVKIENIFQLDGVSLTDRKVIETFADAIKVAEKQILDTLANESVSSGEY